MNHTRRNFLKNAGLLAAGHVPIIAGLSALTTQAFASALQDNSDFNFVLFRVPGGMDSVLGLHPWLDSNSGFSEEDLYLDYNPSTDVLKNIGGTQISLGPSAYSLAPFVKNMAVLRGLFMGASDLGHPSAFQHISAARAQESAPHMAAYYGSRFSDPSRFVITNTSIQRGTVETFPVILTQALKKLGNVSDFSTSSSLDLYKNSDLAVNRYLNLLKQKNKLIKFEEVLNSQKKSTEIFDESVALASLAAGLSRVVQIDMIDEARSLDTHANHYVHKDYQRQRWERIAAFLKGLEENKLMEKTLVVVVTEFNRSPGKNFNQGKDHNYSDNTVALFGRNIQGGRVIGDHKLYPTSQNIPLSLWAGSFLDYKTGKVSDLDALIKLQTTTKITLPEHIDLIRPTDLWATVSNNLSSDIIKNLAPESRIIPGLFKGS